MELHLAFYNNLCYDSFAPLAQLDRVADFESVGLGFKSLMAYQVGAKETLLHFFAQKAILYKKQNLSKHF